MIACLGIADALAGGRGSSPALSFTALTGPMWFFLFGLVFGGAVVSFQLARAVRDSDRALQVLEDVGLIVPKPPSGFSRAELKALPRLTTAINVLGVASPAGFLVGAVWELLRIGTVH